MTPYILLGIFVGLPVIVGLLLRVNAIYLYTSVVVGQLLVLYVGDDAAVAAGSMVRGQYSQVISSLFLLLLPLIITILLLKHTMARTHILLQLPALVAVGGTLYIFAVPQLSAGVIGTVLLSSIGKSMNSSQDIIIAACGLIVVSTMWLTSRHREHKHKKHHK